MNCILAFFLGAVVCAIGILAALIFDIGLSQLESLYRRLTCRK